MSKYIGEEHSERRLKQTFKKILTQLNEYQIIYPKSFEHFIKKTEIQRAIDQLALFKAEKPKS